MVLAIWKSMAILQELLLCRSHENECLVRKWETSNRRHQVDILLRRYAFHRSREMIQELRSLEIFLLPKMGERITVYKLVKLSKQWSKHDFTEQRSQLLM